MVFAVHNLVIPQIIRQISQRFQEKGKVSFINKLDNKKVSDLMNLSLEIRNGNMLSNLFIRIWFKKKSKTKNINILFT